MCSRSAAREQIKGLKVQAGCRSHQAQSGLSEPISRSGQTKLGPPLLAASALTLIKSTLERCCPCSQQGRSPRAARPGLGQAGLTADYNSPGAECWLMEL